MAEAEAALVEQHLEPSTRDFNYDRLRGGELKSDALLAVLGIPPMIAEWRVIVLRDAQRLAPDARCRKAMLAALDNFPPGLALIMNYTLGPGRPPKFFQELRKRSAAHEFRRLSHNELPDWIARRVHALGKEIEPAAARSLAAAVGNDLGVVTQELDKLVELAGDGAVELAHVEAAGTRIPTIDRWSWFDLVGRRSFAEAIASLPDVIHQAHTGRTESVVGLVSGLAVHFLRLGLVAEGGPGALATVLPRHQRWLVDRIASQARRWRTEEISAALDGLLRVDALVKASSHDDLHFLEEWLLARMARRRAA